jgi:hypothetical protein
VQNLTQSLFEEANVLVADEVREKVSQRHARSSLSIVVAQAELKITKERLERKLKEQAFRIEISEELLCALKKKIQVRCA